MTACTDAFDDRSHLLELSLAGYRSPRTRANYAFILNGGFAWCRGVGHHALRDADPRAIENFTERCSSTPTRPDNSVLPNARRATL